MRKILTLLFCLSFLLINLVGCQGAAQKPADPEQKPRTAQENRNTDMSASERRVMASKLSKTAESVEGVQKASVVVAGIGMTNVGLDSRSQDMNNDYGESTNNNMGNNNNINNNMNNNDITNNNNNNNNNSVADRNEASGQIVLVGLTLEPTAKRDTATVDKVKNAVANKLKASDNDISQVLVTTDPNMIKRINDIAQGIIDGRPIQNFKNDINNLTGEIRQQRPAF